MIVENGTGPTVILVLGGERRGTIEGLFGMIHREQMV